MPEPQGNWIAPALSFSERLSALPPDERARAFEIESSLQRITILTLRRNVAAARYCARHAKSVGLKIEDVKSAILAVELLMRLERRDRISANEIRKSVLEGHMSVRRMREYLKSVPGKQSHGRAIDEWGNFALSVVEQCYLAAITSYEMGENSAVGKLLKVDIEVRIGDEKEPHAIFLSPLDTYSECAGLTIDDQIPFILAATLQYTRVNVVLHEQKEGARIMTVLEMMPRPLPGELQLVGLYKTQHDAD